VKSSSFAVVRERQTAHSNNKGSACAGPLLLVRSCPTAHLWKPELRRWRFDRIPETAQKWLFLWLEQNCFAFSGFLSSSAKSSAGEEENSFLGERDRCKPLPFLAMRGGSSNETTVQRMVRHALREGLYRCLGVEPKMQDIARLPFHLAKRGKVICSSSCDQSHNAGCRMSQPRSF